MTGFKLVPEADGRHSLWSTRADGFVLEDATPAELREWAADAPAGATVPSVDELLADAQRRSSPVGRRASEEAPEWLADE